MKWLTFAFLSVLILLQFACDSDMPAEDTFFGPYIGEPYTGEQPALPVSTIAVTPEAILYVYASSDDSDPIIYLRDASGKNLWARKLVPRRVGHKESDGTIIKVNLSKVKKYSDGFKVVIRFHWSSVGSNEWGMIYLNNDSSFRSFSLGT